MANFLRVESKVYLWGSKSIEWDWICMVVLPGKSVYKEKGQIGLSMTGEWRQGDILNAKICPLEVQNRVTVKAAVSQT